MSDIKLFQFKKTKPAPPELPSDHLERTLVMNPLRHIVEPAGLLLTWQPQDEQAPSRTRRVVGEVRVNQDGIATFRYLKDTQDYQGLTESPSVHWSICVFLFVELSLCGVLRFPPSNHCRRRHSLELRTSMKFSAT